MARKLPQNVPRHARNCISVQARRSAKMISAAAPLNGLVPVVEGRSDDGVFSPRHLQSNRRRDQHVRAKRQVRAMLLSGAGRNEAGLTRLRYTPRILHPGHLAHGHRACHCYSLSSCARLDGRTSSLRSTIPMQFVRAGSQPGTIRCDNWFNLIKEGSCVSGVNIQT